MFEDTKTAILRALAGLRKGVPDDISPERWREVDDFLEDQLHTVWAAGYLSGVRWSEAAAAAVEAVEASMVEPGLVAGPPL